MRYLTILLLASLSFTASSASLKDRMNAVKDIRLAIHKCGFSDGNPSLFKKQVEESNDTLKVECLESKSIDIEQDRIKTAERELIKRTGRSIRRFCSGLLDLIVGLNATASLTKQQVNSLQQKFGEIEALIESNRPFSAKPLIEAVTPSSSHETILKTKILEEYAKAGF